MTSVRHWVPLESNPEVLTRFSHALGLSSSVVFSDVWSLELLPMVPRPVHAVLLLLPLTPPILALPPPPVPSTPSTTQPYFMTQNIGNACGTIAILHAVFNAPNVTINDGSFLKTFYDKTKHMDAKQRADQLIKDDMLDRVHDEFAQMGQTNAPAAEEKVDLHFVAFVQEGGRLWEMDGRKEGPMDVGHVQDGQLLEKAAEVIKDRYMKADPSEMRFTILALTGEQ